MVCCRHAGQQLAKVNMPTALGMLVSHLKFELTPEARAPLLSVCDSTSAGSASCVMLLYV